MSLSIITFPCLYWSFHDLKFCMIDCTSVLRLVYVEEVASINANITFICVADVGKLNSVVGVFENAHN